MARVSNSLLELLRELQLLFRDPLNLGDMLVWHGMTSTIDTLRLPLFD